MELTVSGIVPVNFSLVTTSIVKGSEHILSNVRPSHGICNLKRERKMAWIKLDVSFTEHLKTVKFTSVTNGYYFSHSVLS